VKYLWKKIHVTLVVFESFSKKKGHLQASDGGVWIRFCTKDKISLEGI